ncbi:hypothetical protein [Alteromonas ponticola]|uniref:Uncharacterized protein n=1 Tax=Alteromonas ponticola TaxID=2720613 RepID=A0ABX1R3K7_9ALTE|nr:hypothetical protein [Alteromonas ponticola]NMH60066.1 hypothetical protein [Alteromonas ponticola]
MRRYSLPLLALIALSFQVFATEPGVANQPVLEDYSEGEKWVWKYKGVTSKGEVRADGNDTKEIILENGALAMKTAHAVIPLSRVVQADTSTTPRYKWPLEVGNKWKFEQSWTSEDGTQGMTSQHAEVLSYQEETVEAGTFMAYTIKYDGEISNSQGYRADTQDVHVYAPKLKTFIKLTQTQNDYKYVEELIEYTKK